MILNDEFNANFKSCIVFLITECTELAIKRLG